MEVERIDTIRDRDDFTKAGSSPMEGERTKEKMASFFFNQGNAPNRAAKFAPILREERSQLIIETPGESREASSSSSKSTVIVSF